jgi:hypothetical protein
MVKSRQEMQRVKGKKMLNETRFAQREFTNDILGDAHKTS